MTGSTGVRRRSAAATLAACLLGALLATPAASDASTAADPAPGRTLHLVTLSGPGTSRTADLLPSAVLRE